MEITTSSLDCSYRYSILIFRGTSSTTPGRCMEVDCYYKKLRAVNLFSYVVCVRGLTFNQVKLNLEFSKNRIFYIIDGWMTEC